MLEEDKLRVYQCTNNLYVLANRLISLFRRATISSSFSSMIPPCTIGQEVIESGAVRHTLLAAQDSRYRSYMDGRLLNRTMSHDQAVDS